MVHYWVKRLHPREFFLVTLLIFSLPSFFWHNPMNSCLQWHGFVLCDVCMETSWILGLDLAGRAICIFFFFFSIQNHSNIIALWHWTQRAQIKEKKSNTLGHYVQPGAFMQKWKMSIVLPSIILPISLAHNTGLWLMDINSAHTVQ